MSANTIAIYKGAFDPPHLGHQSVIEAAYRALAPKEIVVEVKYVGPKDYLCSASERIRMFELMFGETNLPVKFVKQAPKRHAEQIAQLYSKGSLVVDIYGYDKAEKGIATYGKLPGVTICVNRRSGWACRDDELVTYAQKHSSQITFISSDHSTSSSSIRSDIASSAPKFSGLHHEVIAYIERNRLYHSIDEPDAGLRFFEFFQNYLRQTRLIVPRIRMSVESPPFNNFSSERAWPERCLRWCIHCYQLTPAEIERLAQSNLHA